MRRLLGIVLILHGLAHAGPGMWSVDALPVEAHAFAWILAMGGFLFAGFAVLGVPVARVHWQLALLLAIASSVALLALRPGPVALVGIAIDMALLGAWLRWRAAVSRSLISPSIRRPRLARAGRVVTIVVLGYAVATLAIRPWHMRWGTGRAERAMTLPGDELMPDARYRMDHAVMIDAPAEAVWPWLAQVGQDRAGFYSYAWLENLAGARIRNADSIVPAWQERRVGDLVRAVPPDWMGGRFGREIGWRIALFEPGRGMVLEGWGAFVVVPIDSGSSRLIVRTRGEGRPSLAGTALAPLGLFVFEPAHFLMQRRMLLGIKERAEHHIAASAP